MNKIILEMVAAGIFFGAWPLFMNRSGLKGTTASAVFSIIVLLIVLPIALKSGLNLAGARWWFAVAAGCSSAIGLFIFNNGLANLAVEQVGKMFIIMLVVQTSVPAIYDIIVSGQFALKAVAGFTFALIAIILLA